MNNNIENDDIEITTAEACQQLGGMTRSTYLKRMEKLGRRAINYNENYIKQPPLKWKPEDVQAVRDYAKSQRSQKKSLAAIA